MSFVCNMHNRTTTDYRFSVYTKDDKDLVALRDLIKQQNARIREYGRKFGSVSKFAELQKVRLMPRGPRRIWARQDFSYGKWYNGNYSHYDSYLPHKYAEYFDVYVGADNEAANVFKIELETGMTKAMQEKKRDFEYQAMCIEYEGKARLRNAA